MPAPQTLKNHAKFDPMFHFTLIPLAVINLITSLCYWNSTPHGRRHLAFAWTFTAIILFLLAFKTRLYALRNQDRLIRLEERIRLTALLPVSEHATLYGLSTSQLIALRFASDAELPALARRALAEGLTSRQIKEAILDWRPDYLRV